MSSSIVFFCVTGLITLCLPPYLFFRYIKPSSFPISGFLTISLCWLFSVAEVIVIWPFDLTVTLQARCNAANAGMSTSLLKTCEMSQEEVSIARSSLVTTYQVIFWVMSMFLGWLVMETQSYYFYSGDFNFWAKLKYAIRQNAYVYGLTIGIALPIFIGFWYSSGINYAVGFVFAIANLYSLFLITCLMSFGLVNIPRTLYCQFRIEAEIERIYFESWSVNQDIHDAEFDLKQKLALLKHLEDLIPEHDNFRPFLEEIKSEIPFEYMDLERRVIGRSQIISDDFPFDLADLSEEKLARIRESVRQVVHSYETMEVQYNKLISLHMYYEDLKSAKANGKWVIEWNSTNPESSGVDHASKSSFSIAFSRLEYIWYIYVRPFVFLILFLLSVVWSSFTIVAEISLISGRSPNLSVLSYIYDIVYDHSISVGVTLFVLFMMVGYQVLTTFYSLFSFRLGRFYAVYSEQQTSNDQLVYNALYMARFAPSLIQNFVKLLRLDNGGVGYIGTSFSEFYGFIDLIPFLGNGVEVIFPLLLGVMIIITWFGQRIYVNYLKQFHFVLLDWVEDHVITPERLKIGADFLTASIRRGMGPISFHKVLPSRQRSHSEFSLFKPSPSPAPTSYVELHESKLDVPAYLKTVRERHEHQKKRREAN